MAITITDGALLRLMQLASPSLPVGGYAFSQGMESACEQQWVTNYDQCQQWLACQLQHSLAYVDVPLLLRMHAAAKTQDWPQLAYWDEYLLASRETHELHLTDTAMGQALRRLLLSQDIPVPLSNPLSFAAGFALAANHWRLGSTACALAYCWSWLENQIAAATKLVPLGQTQAQRLLGDLQTLIEPCIEQARALADDEIGASLPALAIASSQHEHQYSRIFRS